MKFPYKWKQRGTSRKRILIDTFKDILPGEIFKRAKMGFGVPIARWLRQEWYSQTKSLLMDGHLTNNGYIEKERIKWLIEAHRNEKIDHSYAIFALIVLEIWFQENSNLQFSPPVAKLEVRILSGKS